MRWVKTTFYETGCGGNGPKRCSNETVVGSKNFFEPLPSPHDTSNQRRLVLRLPPPPPNPVPALMRMGASVGIVVQTRIHCIHHHIKAVATRARTAHQPLPPMPPLPPLPPQPHHRRRNRGPCGESCVRREFNTLGECSFHAKAEVAVDAATIAVTITSGRSSHHRLHQPRPPPLPPKSLRLR